MTPRGPERALQRQADGLPAIGLEVEHPEALWDGDTLKIFIGCKS